jgi:hypothetical protein
VVFVRDEVCGPSGLSTVSPTAYSRWLGTQESSAGPAGCRYSRLNQATKSAPRSSTAPFSGSVSPRPSEARLPGSSTRCRYNASPSTTRPATAANVCQTEACAVTT